MTAQSTRTRARARSRLIAALLVLAGLLLPAGAAAAADIQVGDSVWVGPRQGYSGTGVFPIFSPAPADPGNPGTPDFWAYCVEHDVHAATGLEAVVGDLSSYLGTNHFADPQIQGKVLWIISHSYPAMSLADFGAAAGVPTISRDDAIEATQYAIWAFTELSGTPAWAWETPDSEAAYYYLMSGAHASSGLTSADVAATVSVAAPAGPQVAGTLVGPFVVTTDQPVASVTTAPGATVTDASGVPIDPGSVVDGQQLYLDLRGATTSGTATVTATVAGSSATGSVISVPTVAGATPTAGDHAQSIILVAASTATTSATATVQWAAAPLAQTPSISTTLLDSADGDHVLAWDGGTVTDTISYHDLVPGTTYTVSGELVRKPAGTATGITGTTTFTPTTADGTVAVTFAVPAGHAGEVLVAFETLVETGSGTVVAEHKDIDDAAQTVTVEDETASPTPTRSSQPTPSSASRGPGSTDGPQTGDPSTDAATDPTPREDEQLAQTGAGAAAGLLALATAGMVAGAGLLVVRRRLVRG